MKSMMTLLLLLSALSWSRAVAAETQTHQQKKTNELAAIHTQEQSIRKLVKFLKDHPGDPREPDFLIRLADLYFEKSGISFFYTEGESVKTSKKFYTDALEKGVSVLSTMLAKYPSHVSVSDAWFKRGKAYKELKRIELSRADFLRILATAPDYYRLDSALMDLAVYAQEENRHEEALKYLLMIEKKMASQYYTIALHKAGWSYFNLGDFKRAIQYLKKEILAEQDRKSELPYLESAYQDLALFYFEAINRKAGFADVTDAVSLFHELAGDRIDTQKRPFFGTVLVRFAKLLKAYQLSVYLERMKELLLRKYPKMPETTEIAMLMYEYYFERHEYSKLTAVLEQVDPSLSQKYEQTVAQSLSQLHQMILKNKTSTELDRLFLPLISLTHFVRDRLGMKNPTAVTAVYSLAETSFSVGRFTDATRTYSEVLAGGVVLPPTMNRADLMIRLVSSRFQELKQKTLIQEHLTIAELNQPLKSLKKDDLGLVREWSAWVGDPLMTKNLDSVSFQLEAHKLAYDFLDRRESVRRMEEFAVQNAALGEGQTAAAIVLDTLSLSREWGEILAFSRELMATKKVKDQAFQEKVAGLMANSHLRITLAATDPKLILSRTKDCARDFKVSKVLLQCKMIQAKTLVELKQYGEGERLLTELSHAPLTGEEMKNVMLMTAEVHQKQGKISQSIDELERFLSMIKFQDGEMTQQVLRYRWFQNDQAKVAKMCASVTNRLCAQYSVARHFQGSLREPPYQNVFKQTVKGEKETVALWALLALTANPQKLPFQDRLVLLQRLSSHFEHLDPYLQLEYLHVMRARVNATVESIRKSSSAIAPVTSDPSSIEKRIRMLQDVDHTFSKVMKLEWLEIKLKTMNELQLVYQQLISDLQRIGTPESLLRPFAKKQALLAEASQKLLSMSVRYRESAPAILLGSEVQGKIPLPYRAEWQKGIQNQKPDYLYYLISLRQQDEYSPILRGLVLVSLLGNSAAAEGYELIRSAPDSPWKTSVLSHFELRGPSLGVTE